MSGVGAVGSGNNARALYELSQAAAQDGDLNRAVALADQVLSLTDYSLQACAWAARLRVEMRRWRDAIDLSRIGLSKGSSPGLLVSLGRALEASREYDEAEAVLRQAVELQPERGEWKLHLAGVLLKTDREFEAMEQFQAGCETEPNPPCLFLLAHLELSFGDPYAAWEAIEKALKSGEPDAMDLTIIARVLTELGREDEAQHHWEAARARSGPHREEIDLREVRSLRELGRFDAALAKLERLVAQKPRSAPALALLAESRKATEADLPLIDGMEELASDAKVPMSDRKSLEYAAGKGLDELGRFERAMRHFDRANEIGFESIRARGGFDQAAYSEMLQARIEVFSKENIDRIRSLGSEPESPIFVVGMIRSGTTLLEQILARHPGLVGAGEQKLWIAADRKLLDLANRTLNEEVLSETAATYKRLLNRYGKGTKRVVDKQPGNLLLVGAIYVAFPNARIVYMHRDALDNAVSIWNTNIQTSVPFVHHKGNLAFALREHGAVMRHWSEVLPADRLLVLSYESLVLDQEASTRRVLGFCDLPWDEACLTPENGTGRVITPSLWQVRQPVYRSSVGRWKNYEPWLGDLMKLKESG